MSASIGSGLVLTSEEDVEMQDSAEFIAHLNNGFANEEPNGLIPDDSEEGVSESVPTASDTDVMPPRVRALLPSGVCYDARMKLHANADFSGQQGHPEDPHRISAIFQELKDHGMIFLGNDTELQKELLINPQRWMWRIAAREATRNEICLVHTAPHFEWVNGLDHLSSAQLREMTTTFDNGRKSLYVGNLTNQAALLAAGGAIETCKNVVAGKVKNAIAVIRPPGHHAEHNEAMGFCLYNNVPIAARVCQEDYPELCRKVLILDWVNNFRDIHFTLETFPIRQLYTAYVPLDVHHGNGIQNMFYDNPNVLYISLHVYKDGSFYPGQPEDGSGLPDGAPENVGLGSGMGRNINIGWHDQGMGDGEYMAAFQKIVMPVAQEFDPDLVIVSAGFDAAAGDELGGCFVTPECYSQMTHMLMALANGKVAVCLEGGYNLKAIARSALAVAKTLMGEPPARLVNPNAPLNHMAAGILHQVKQCHAPYWTCLQEGIIPRLETNSGEMQRLHDVVRIAKRADLNTKYSMTSLHVKRDFASQSFDGQVLCTPDLHLAKKVILIIHDPPEVLGNPNPVTNSIMAHNSFVRDPVDHYIDWAIKAGFGIFDINVPMHLTKPDDNTTFQAQLTDEELSEQLRELLCYLWDNYLEGYNANYVVLMGVGDAYLGCKQLLTSRVSRHKIPCVLSFVQGSLRPVRSETDNLLSQWYRQNSLIFVAPDHACWNEEESARKVKKQRFGGVKMSENAGLSQMMYDHFTEATEFIERKMVEKRQKLRDTGELSETDYEGMDRNEKPRGGMFG